MNCIPLFFFVFGLCAAQLHIQKLKRSTSSTTTAATTASTTTVTNEATNAATAIPVQCANKVIEALTSHVMQQPQKICVNSKTLRSCYRDGDASFAECSVYTPNFCVNMHYGTAAEQCGKDLNAPDRWYQPATSNAIRCREINRIVMCVTTKVHHLCPFVPIYEVLTPFCGVLNAALNLVTDWSPYGEKCQTVMHNIEFCQTVFRSDGDEDPLL